MNAIDDLMWMIWYWTFWMLFMWIRVRMWSWKSIEYICIVGVHQYSLVFVRIIIMYAQCTSDARDVRRRDEWWKAKHRRLLVVNDYSMVIVKIATFQIKIESKIKASVEITTINGQFFFLPYAHGSSEHTIEFVAYELKTLWFYSLHTINAVLMLLLLLQVCYFYVFSSICYTQWTNKQQHTLTTSATTTTAMLDNNAIKKKKKTSQRIQTCIKYSSECKRHTRKKKQTKQTNLNILRLFLNETYTYTETHTHTTTHALRTILVTMWPPEM